MLDALGLLGAVAQFTQGEAKPNRDSRLAVIDPAYDDSQYPTVLPKVTFEGETTMSARTYPVISPYWPKRGDRVWMARLGKGWVIVGGVEEDRPNLGIRGVTTARSTALRHCNAAAQDVPGASVVLTPQRAGGIWIGVWQADFQSLTTTATTGIVQCLANGAIVGTQAIWNQSNVAVGARVTAVGFGAGVMNSPTGDVTLKLQTTRSGGADSAIGANASHTALLVVHLE